MSVTQGQPADHTRREFLKKTALGVGVAAAGLSGILASRFRRAPQAPGDTGAAEGSEGDLPRPIAATARLGRTGMEVPRFCVGVNEIKDPEALKVAFAAGFTFVETARKYGRKRAEVMIGEAMRAARVPRERMIITTKSTQLNEHHLHEEGSAEAFHREVDESLRALGTDYIDIFMVHDLSDPGVYAAARLEEHFARLKQRGVIRACGISTHDLNALAPLIEKNPFLDVVLVMYNYMMPASYVRQIEALRAKGVGIIGMKTQMNAGRVAPQACPAAIRFAASRSFLDSVTLRVETRGDVQRYREILAQPFTNADQALLEKHRSSLSVSYCRSCHQCVADCREHLPIPSVMRSLMYHEAYAKPEMALENYGSLSPTNPAGTCASCARCTVTCPHSLPVKERMMAALRTFGAS